jgi:UDP-N-acetylglucosamine--N-acetylmuramyl-(pentapeptide) pyrophosphoryl-undecaprenol N-acetylglucosamine transferase
MRYPERSPLVALACAESGGHYFPAVALSEQFAALNCRSVVLLASRSGNEYFTAQPSMVGTRILWPPASRLTGRFRDLQNMVRVYRLAKATFRHSPPDAVLGMGGLITLGPLLAARRIGAKTFFFEPNAVLGRANRLLAHGTDGAFAGFETVSSSLANQSISILASGTPVRSCFTQKKEAGACRTALGLSPQGAVCLVCGGSQGANGLNELVSRVLVKMAHASPGTQWLHLAGHRDAENLEHAYKSAGLRAVVLPFVQHMDLALGAATAAITRSGASMLAELAAVRLPSILVPFPGSRDGHQIMNAQIYQQEGAAYLLDQSTATARKLEALATDILSNRKTQLRMQAALARMHKPNAAADIAMGILDKISSGNQKGFKAQLNWNKQIGLLISCRLTGRTRAHIVPG